MKSKYNIRGWLTGINDINGNMLGAGQLPGSSNDGLFAFKINYDKIDNHGNAVSKLYNGNISQTFWKSGDNTMRGYDYSYDMLNRLRNADYFIQGIPSYTGAYRENIGYDLNGNITELFRTMGDTFGNAVNMDILTYHYKNGNGNSNQLRNVSDAASLENSEGFVDGNTNPALDDYAYDENGNMIKDRNKGITNITYNHLNLPVRITISSLQFIDYQYNAAGVKVSKTVTDGDGFKKVDYQDGFQSRKLSGAGEVLQFFPTAEGYVSAIPIKQLGSEVITGYTYKHIFNYTDHLGNVRLSFSTRSNGRLEVMNENHYYPFGMKHSVYVPADKKIFGLNPGEEDLKIKVVTKTEYQYKYNGKELQDELGLNMYAMDMRMYDPAIARWGVMDPVIHHSMSPYNAFDNNPVFWADPSGADSENNLWDETDKSRSTEKMIQEKAAENSNRITTTYVNRDTGESVWVNDGVNDIVLVNSYMFAKAKNFANYFNKYYVDDKNLVASNYKDFYYEARYGKAYFFDIDYWLDSGPKFRPSVIGGSGGLEYLGIGGVFKIGKAAQTVKALPSLDATGKVHGTLPKVQDLGKYSKDELRILLKELKQSVQKRIDVTSKMGRDRGHGQRQGAEQDLIKSLEKYLGQ